MRLASWCHSAEGCLYSTVPPSHTANAMVCRVGARLLPASGPQWLSIVSVSAISIHTAQMRPVELHARLEEVDLTVLQSMIKLQMSLHNGP